MTDLEAGETGPEDSRPTTPYRQTVRSAAGFAYGVIGADLHVFGDGVPLYLLLNWQGEAAMDSAWLRRMPSRMLNARFAVVPFTGRGRALEELRRWRDDDRDRLSIRWLHSEGGSGKSRLAARLCGESAAAGWKVIVAVPGPGGVFPPPGSQDLSADGADGLLLLVDYADRWPETHLAWLLSNALLHRPQPRVRVLMIARTISPLPRLRAALADQQVEVSSQHLPALRADAAEEGDDAADPADDGRAPPRAAGELGQRADMFRAARAAFAERYGIADPDDIAPPGSLDQPEMGLVLAVHMAALVAVDARHNRQPPPTDYTGLSLYLLDREYRHWERMHGDGTHELDPAGRDHRTSPATMQRIVFAATLTGPLPPDAGSDLLGRIGAVPGTADPAQALADHGQCYPPAVDGNGTVFEPLYPDRLAEDFLALTLPGHRVAYPHQEWASGALGALLARSGPDRQQPWWTGRVLSFLIAAGDRWPHVRAAHLYPLLARDPRLAVDGGSSVLTGLAGLADVGPPLLTAVKQELLRGGRPNLQTGVAAVIERLAPHELSRARTDRARDDIYGELWLCLWEAGQYGRSITALQEAIAINRRRAHPGPAARLTRRLRRADTDDIKLELVNKLINLSSTLLEAGEPERAMAAAQEGLAICPELSDAPHVLTPERTAALQNISRALSTLGRADEALAVSREIVDIRREQGGGYPFLVTPPLAQLPGGNPPPYVLARDRFLSDPGAQENGLATALANLAIRHAQGGHYEDAVASMAEALQLRLDGSDADQWGNAAVIAADLSSYARMLGHVGRLDDAAAVAEVAVSRGRALAEANSARYGPFLANALASLSQRLEKLGRRDEAAAAVQEAIQIGRRHPGTPVEEAQRVVLLSDLARFRSVPTTSASRSRATRYRRPRATSDEAGSRTATSRSSSATGAPRSPGWGGGTRRSTRPIRR